jgi:hypothetical protein
VKFTLDTNGCAMGNTVTNPFAAASTAVTFNDTALTPVAGDQLGQIGQLHGQDAAAADLA